jgi:acetyl-CoA C-acetyltransferase
VLGARDGEAESTLEEETEMAEAYIVEAVRTPVGRRGGGLSQVHPADLGAHSIRALIERAGVDPAAVDDVVFGNVDSIGPQAGDIARTCWLVAGFPEHVPGTTVDRQCGSAQQAIHFAAQGVMSGTQDLVVAGGVQNMSQIPIMSAMEAGQKFGHETPFASSPGWQARYGGQEVSQFRGAEMIAEKWDISRDDMEAFAMESHERALRAQAEGRFDHEIAPLAGCDRDEGPRAPDAEKIRSLRTLVEGGRLTAAVSSQISDGSAAVLVASEGALQTHGLTPRARIHHMSVRGDDPIFMLTAPIPATAYALEKTGLTPDDIDLVEINEAFASVVLAWLKDSGFDGAKTNVNGGAIALGHPLGATGARLMTTMLNELERTGGRYGLQTMCEGGGQANVTIIERL